MRFTFSRRFYILFAFGVIPLSLSWNLPVLRYIVLAFDIALIAAAIADYFRSRSAALEIGIRRSFNKRFAIGDPTEVTLHIESSSIRPLLVRIKDEYPAEMKLNDPREVEFELAEAGTADFTYSVTPPRRGRYYFGTTAVRFLSRWRLVWCQADIGSSQNVKVYPNMRRAREMELRALGARSFLSIQRRAVRRGEGREFESMRDYVRGDELRHISWTATARRSKITTRHYQIERDQTVIIALDAGRLMTGRIGDETKFDTALHASLALMSACARAGDNCGLVVFGRRIRRSIAPRRGIGRYR